MVDIVRPSELGGIPVWDSKPLDSLARQIDDGPGLVIAHIVGVYLDQSRRLIDQLERAAERRDQDELRVIAHSLKGSTATVGGGRLAALCERLERSERAESSLWENAAAVRPEFDGLAVQLAGYLSARVSPAS